MSQVLAHLSKVKSRKGRRVLEKRAPRWKEQAKRVLLLEGGKSSAKGKDVLNELAVLKKGEALRLSRKNENISPFESGGEAPLERLCQKSDCGMFAFTSHSKKRPHNLILGRMFDYHLFDLLELGIEEVKTMREFGAAAGNAAAGSKPCVLFMGDKFESQPELRACKSLLLDLLRGLEVDAVSLMGLDRVIVIAETGGKVYFRQCYMKFKKSGTTVPRVELTEMGPSFNFTVRRYRAPQADLAREALRAPPKGAPSKNMHKDVFGETYGKVYLPKQDVEDMALRKMKGLKRERVESKLKTKADKKDKEAEEIEDAGEVENVGKMRGKKQRKVQDEESDE
mmetsp:Transcript_28668/g.39599  ORF Transcript_28668/g.39599 Transcript_28668/m.39599 type:complete len:339 (-) Transcript_28668:366-1382(-)|eukprot:CAMPEP_0196573694 /NCGR_PEP_ID=MMETSP1081-20130531/3558_1 /TAXON_ID=36882 /ORGANISM="Pyramimonas amylifera, Strain CCMP720" /LENGTH=338 /DNA_ID=CAMNT_0041891509 /DNA_START=14 /DNA_END=1030 /DNA_ORIENTATION=-